MRSNTHVRLNLIPGPCVRPIHEGRQNATALASVVLVLVIAVVAMAATAALAA